LSGSAGAGGTNGAGRPDFVFGRRFAAIALSRLDSGRNGGLALKATIRTTFALAATLTALLALRPGASDAQVDPKVGVSVEGVQRVGDEVTGWVVNGTGNEVTDVRLLVQQNWRWTKEMQPGEDNPGRGTIVRLPEPIPAGGRLRFRYDMPLPLPERSDGSFETDVKVMGFTERWLEVPATATRTSPGRP